MKRLRIVGTTTATPKALAPLPGDVERLLPYTTDSYAPLTTPVKARQLPKRRRVSPWIGFGVLALSSFATLGLAVAVLATRPGTPPAPEPVSAPTPRLRTNGGNTLSCLADALAIFVTDADAGGGVLVGTLSGTNASLVFTLDGGAGVYAADITMRGGVLRSSTAVRGQSMAVSPRDTLLLQVDGVAGARRLVVTGRATYGSREREVCQ